jgi:hypothetical protein
MPIFYLEPKHDTKSDPRWEASYVSEGCWVVAESEEVARLRLDGATKRFVDMKPGQKIVYSPWIDPTVTTCKEGKPPRDIPDGKVLTSSGKLIDA